MKRGAIRLSFGRKPGNAGDPGERGYALVIVLWVLALLTMIATEFVSSVRAETLCVRNSKALTSAYYLAVAGVEAALAELPDSYDAVSLDASGRLVFRSLASGPGEGGKVTVMEARSGFKTGGGTVSYEITDERSKLNLNVAGTEAIESLLKHAGADESLRDIISDSLDDWKDRNDEFRLNGAEADYYGSLQRPYGSKNGGLHTAEELLLVRGVTPEVFYGSGRVPLEFGPGGGTGAFAGLRPFVTAASGGGVNMNTAPEPVLEAVFGKGRAMEIVLKRSMDGFIERPFLGGGITSDTFSIVSTGAEGGSRVTVTAVVKRLPSGGYEIEYWNEGGLTPSK